MQCDIVRSCFPPRFRLGLPLSKASCPCDCDGEFELTGRRDMRRLMYFHPRRSTCMLWTNVNDSSTAQDQFGHGGQTQRARSDFGETVALVILRHNSKGLEVYLHCLQIPLWGTLRPDCSVPKKLCHSCFHWARANPGLEQCWDDGGPPGLEEGCRWERRASRLSSWSASLPRLLCCTHSLYELGLRWDSLVYS